MAAVDQLKCGGKVKGRKKDGGSIRYQDGGTVLPDKMDFSKMDFSPQERMQYEKYGFGYPWDAVANKSKYKFFPDTYDMYGGSPQMDPNDEFVGSHVRSKFYARGREGATPNVRKRIMSMLNVSGVKTRQLNNDFSRKELQGIWDDQDPDRLNEYIKYLSPEKIKSKVPKLHEGGITKPADLLNTSGNPAKPGIGFDLTSGIAEMATDLTDTAFDTGKASLQADYDNREDPTEMLRKSNLLDTGKAIAKGAAKGAAIGSAIPVVGTAIGAGVGALTAGLGRLIGKKKRDKETEEAQSQWSSHWTGRAASYAGETGYKEGGKVKGKGSPRSDSIKMTAEDGSFIVPAENAETGMDIGKEYLGWNDNTTADRKNKGTGLKVSDGEIFYTPEEVGILKYYGVDLDGLAPNAEPEHKMKDGGLNQKKKYESKSGDVNNFQEGGWKFDKEAGRVISSNNKIQYDQEGNEYKIGTSGEFELFNKNTIYGRSIFSEHSGVKPEKKEKEKEGKRNIFDVIPEIAGTLQTLGGAYGLIEAGKRPDLNVSHTLKKLSAETRRLANYGYPPEVLNALNTQIEKTRRDMTKAVTTKGGSPQENMEKMKMILSSTIDKKAGVVFQNAQEKARKWADVLRIDTLKAGQEFDINKIDIADWYRGQEVYADLLSSGISNIVGARQLKTQQDLIREVGSANPTFTLTT